MQENQLMVDKVCLITGATSGIGLVTAREMAHQGADLVLVSRSEDKCRRVAESLRDETKNQQIDYLAGDLSSLKEIRQVADQFQERYSRLDVLVNNAGRLFWQRKESADGLEMTFALNHLGYFTLTALLLDTLKKSAPARIVNVSSGAHRGHRLDFDDLQMEENYSPNKAYGRSKLANLYFTYALDRRLEGTGVTVNALHPGFVNTNFAREGNSPLRFLMPLMQLFARSPEEGAETVIYLASSPEVKGVTGKYYKDKEPVKSSPTSYQSEPAEKLWERSEEIVGWD